MGQFLGFLFFLTMAMCGFWCLTFLVSIVPYWLTYGVAERFGKINKNSDPDEVRRKLLSEQSGVEVLYKK
ncbi:hypothetical protein EQP59_00590 [Ornithobacterium rhinotracheale]|uniref:Uncharacterized protein n=1 Tax=Ornithobacterium rhinotracheale TaxID=28251 RepID=A0A410JPC0_ORNRH|nr:hypothetical protein [Ornithobacterium rhinotracheale]MRI63752.1 hypothetical protein [Ornithobacterium rhinotracheale]MRJ07329.1 hypothetical protein [Ornithobacterium rhinotracheale]MRJ09652.1 hypothetical protein [Ornithobacterium rhinotracheale]QAR29962.1 hypothetical protein EQP59_00590 [Ornithobacterium rhinotracheale]UOH77930.1 hypothetical protein MT996_00320 [Ornithobacterium rhinotracheale]